MNDLTEAIRKVKSTEGSVGAVTLGLYKKASAALCLQEETPRVATTITESFFKAACDSTVENTTTRTWLIVKGLTKIAGTEASTEVMEKLAELAVNHNGEVTSDEVKECYECITSLVK